jgi:hypothetical protein
MSERKYKRKELEACVLRELGQRHYVYDRRVQAGKMTPARRDREIAMMTEVLHIVQALPDDEAPADPLAQGGLFGC